MLKLNKQQMHQRPTYETLVRDTILNPKDKINLPNRQATLLRLTQKLQMFDDESFIDIDEENKRIAAERMQQVHLQEIVSDKGDTELKTEQAQRESKPPPVIIYSPKKQPQQPKQLSSSTSQEPNTTHMSASSSQEPLHLPPSTEKTVSDLQKHYQEFIDFRDKQTQDQKSSIENLVNKNLGTASGTSNTPYVHKLADMQSKTHVRQMDTSTDPNMDTTTTTVEKRFGSPIKQPSKKVSADPNMDTTSTTVEKRIASPTKQPSKKSKPDVQQTLPAPESTASKPKKTINKVKTSYTAPELSAKIPTKSRVNNQAAYEILADAVNKNVITGVDAIEINDLIKNSLSTDPKDKTKKSGTNAVKKKLATARLKELYGKHYEALKKHHQSK